MNKPMSVVLTARFAMLWATAKAQAEGMVRSWGLGRYLDDRGEVGVAHILVALIVVVIGVLILVTLLPIMSDSIASYSANYSGPGTALLLIIPLVIIAAAILWVLSVFDII